MLGQVLEFLNLLKTMRVDPSTGLPPLAHSSPTLQLSVTNPPSVSHLPTDTDRRVCLFLRSIGTPLSS